MVFATIQQIKSYNLIANKQNRDSLNLSQILNHCLELKTLLPPIPFDDYQFYIWLVSNSLHTEYYENCNTASLVSKLYVL